MEKARRKTLEYPKSNTSDKNLFGCNSLDLFALKWRPLQIDKCHVNVFQRCSVAKNNDNNSVESLF